MKFSNMALRRPVVRENILYEKIFFWGTIVLLISKLLIRVWTLDKGLVFNDEGWYLYLLRDAPREISSTNFFKYFHGFFHGNILFVRSCVLFADLLAILVFSAGLYVYFKPKYNFSIKTFFLIIAYSFIGFNLCEAPICSVFSYITMNRQILLISFGFLLAAIQSNSYKATLLYAISGFFLGALFFVMITNIPIVIFVLLYIWFETKKKTTIVFCCLGMLLSMIYYFTFVESFEIYISNFIRTFQMVSSNEVKGEYGIVPMMHWVRELVLFLLYSVFIPTMSLFGLQKIKSSSKSIGYWVLFIVFTVFTTLLFYYNNIYKTNNGVGISSLVPIYIFYFFLLFSNLLSNKKFRSSQLLYVLIGFLTPVCLSLGSNISFEIRATAYLMFVLPIIYILSFEFIKPKLIQVIFLLIVFLYAVNIVPSLKKENWGRVAYNKQKICLTEIGIQQSIKLDQARIQDLEYLRKYVKKNKWVVLSHQNLWGYAYLLDLKPVKYDFRFNPNLTLQYKNTVFIEDASLPFDSLLLNQLKARRAIRINILNRFNIYEMQ